MPVLAGYWSISGVDESTQMPCVAKSERGKCRKSCVLPAILYHEGNSVFHSTACLTGMGLIRVRSR
jgi:hypothetical protein